MPDIVTKKLNQEVKAGRISGPYQHSPFEQFIISPLGLREKKVKGQFRVIHDLSYPYNEKSVNSNISRDDSSVQYASIVDAIKYVNIFGKNCYMAKSDIKSAFRIIPIHPTDRHLLGMKWMGEYYFDNCLPMGCSSSCNIFETFSTALEWIVKQHCPGVGIVHVLDDFLFISENYQSCQLALDRFIKICEDIGVPLAPDKTEGPTQSLPFVGINIDTVSMTASLPDDKVVKFLDNIEECLSVKSITFQKLQSICGMLNFACGVIPQARAFIRRMYNLGIGISKPYYKVKMTKEVKSDLQVWKSFLMYYNSQNVMLDYKWISDQNLRMFTDAASTIGFGGYFDSYWFYGSWSQNCLGMNIALLELYPIVLAIHLWYKKLKNKCLTIHSDNMAVVHIINQSTSKDASIMKLVRKLVLKCMSENIYIRAVHILGRLNECSDFLSRDKVPQARKVNPRLTEHPENIPPRWTLDKWLAE